MQKECGSLFNWVFENKEALPFPCYYEDIQSCWNKVMKQHSIRLDSASVKVSFWDELAESFASELDKVAETPIIIVVAGCKHNEYKEEPYVSNVGATRFYINYNHRSVNQMKHRASLPDFYQYHSVKSESEMTHIMAVADLRNLDATYIMREIVMINGKYRCEECKRNIPFPDKRFRLCMIAYDATGSAAFIVFNREVESILGRTVYDVQTKHERERKMTEFPCILKSFEENQYSMTVCISDENVNKNSHTYSIIDMYKGFEIIENNSPDDDDFSVGFKNLQAIEYGPKLSRLKLSTTNTPDKHGTCQRPLGHSGGGPPLDTCKQSAQARRPPLPRSNGPDLEAPNQQLHLTPTQKIQERRRTEPPAHRSYHLALEGGDTSLGLGAPGFIFISKLLRESTFKPVRT
ncbi:hypothetical protein AgCh_001827 [Apium graveolens]